MQFHLQLGDCLSVYHTIASGFAGMAFVSCHMGGGVAGNKLAGILRMLAKAAVLAITAVVLVQSAWAQIPAAVIRTAAGYTLDSPLEALAADPAAAAILNKDIPGLLTNPSYGLIKSMTLKTIARLSGGDLTDQMLAQTETDLNALPARKSQSPEKAEPQLITDSASLPM